MLGMSLHEVLYWHMGSCEIILAISLPVMKVTYLVLNGVLCTNKATTGMH